MLQKLLVKEVIGPIIIIALAVVIYFITTCILKKVFKKRAKKSGNRKYITILDLICNVIKYFIIILSFLMILEIYNIDTKGIIASLSAVSLVIGLAFQDTIKDLISGFTIIFEGQFRVGDTVTINQFKGEVIALGLKTTKLKAYTGEYYFISNRLISDVINHSLDYSLALVDVNISYESDLNKALKALDVMCQNLTITLPNLLGKVEVLGVDSLADSSVIIKIAAKCIPMKHITLQREILKEVKNTLDKKGIEIPYKHVVIKNEQ